MGKENIYNRLMSAIGNPYGVCGLMGNIQAESNFRSNNMQNGYEARLGFNDETYTQAVDNGTYTKFATDSVGYGLCQWTSSGRKAGFLGFANRNAKSIGDENMQIDYIMYELTTAYKKVLEVLKNAKSVKEASDYVCTKYERPADQSEKALAKRASYGEAIYKEFVKEETPDYTVGNSPLVDFVRISPNSSNPRNQKISKITIHHMAGNLTVERCGELFSNPERQASSNYAISTDGRVGMYVEEKNRAWTSGNRENDNMAVTIEVANDGGSPNWHVSDVALAKLIDLCTDICKRNEIEKLNYTGDKSGNLTMHKWFQATTCPGPYLESKFPYIAAEVNKRLGVVEEVTQKKIYRVQVGAFSVKENAVKLQAELKAKGYSAIIV